VEWAAQRQHVLRRMGEGCKKNKSKKKEGSKVAAKLFGRELKIYISECAVFP
jgi:hypothetical protein